jgi:hypothetical protein
MAGRGDRRNPAKRFLSATNPIQGIGAGRRLLGGLLLLLLSSSGWSQSGSGPADRRLLARQPRLEAVAETRLLMEGLALPNFRGLGKLLRQRPDSLEAWTFARGQALLIAETGNLLMLRPPRAPAAQAAWFARAMDLRDVARELARSAAAQDYERSRANFVRLANACNHCHQTFRKPIEIVPFEEAMP